MNIEQLTTQRGAEDAAHLVLLQRVATKDKIAFEQLYRIFTPRLSRYLIRLLRRPELVEEVVSDTLFIVWEKASQFQGRSKVSTWITGIAYLKGIKALDKLKKMPEQQADDLFEQETLEDHNDLINRMGLQDWLQNGLHLISADQRTVIELTYFSGHSYHEIAEIMGCPINTVKTRMFHARRRLACLLPALAGLNRDTQDSETVLAEKGSANPAARTPLKVVEVTVQKTHVAGEQQ